MAAPAPGETVRGLAVPYDPRRLWGYHPPACTCYRCNEERLARETAEEEDRRVAEYDRRMAEVQARSQTQNSPQGRNRPQGFPPSTYKPSTPPDPAANPPQTRAPQSSAGSTGIAGGHPESCPCGICTRDRQIKEAERRQEERRRARNQARGQTPNQSRPQGFPPATYKPSASSGSAPQPGSPGGQGRPGPQPPSQPPSPPPQSSAPSGTWQGQPSHSKGLSRTAILWLLLIGIAVGVSVAAVSAANPGLLAPSGDGDPAAIAAAAPTPTKEADVFASLRATPPAPATPVPPPPAPAPTPILMPTQEPTPAPRPTAEPTPTPPPLVVYGGWNLDCPGCPVVLLDAREPEVAGASGLRPGETLRVVGCTRMQTTAPHRYVFETVDGHHSGVVTFNPREHPGTVHGLRCFEMLGEYWETNWFAVGAEYVNGRWEHELIRGEAAEGADGPEWEPMGVLTEFAVTEWAEISEIDYALAVKVGTAPRLRGGAEDRAGELDQ